MPDRIGKAGQLQEWLDDWDLDAPEQDHRHVSHLYAAYPGLAIDTVETPELAGAVKRSLNLRGDEATGWGIAWRICLWARMGDAERAWSILETQLSPSRTYDNLFDAHPPFQIDGNFGAAVGILEMLAHSRQEEIRLLPALPEALSRGGSRVCGLRDGIELDMAWQGGRVTIARLLSHQNRSVRVRLNGELVTVDLASGAWIEVAA